jgi:hypothetical protein
MSEQTYWTPIYVRSWYEVEIDTMVFEASCVCCRVEMIQSTPATVLVRFPALDAMRCYGSRGATVDEAVAALQTHLRTVRPDIPVSRTVKHLGGELPWPVVHDITEAVRQEWRHA